MSSTLTVNTYWIAEEKIMQKHQIRFRINHHEKLGYYYFWCMLTVHCLLEIYILMIDSSFRNFVFINVLFADETTTFQITKIRLIFELWTIANIISDSLEICPVVWSVIFIFILQYLNIKKAATVLSCFQ